MPSNDGDASALRAWLRRQGVSAKRAAEVLHRSGCQTAEQLALYLRFQLPPLEFANGASVARHMRELFGVGASRGRAMIKELGVAGAARHSLALLPCACAYVLQAECLMF